MIKSLTLFTLSILLLAGCSTSTAPTATPTDTLSTDTLPSLMTNEERAAAEARLDEPDFEVSHIVRDTEFTGSVSAVGALHTDANKTLTQNSKAYLEAFLNNEEIKYFNTTTTYQCEITLLGYDDRYAYALTGCRGSNGSGRGDTMRFEYDANDQIIDFKMVGDDTPVRILLPESMADALLDLQ